MFHTERDEEEEEAKVVNDKPEGTNTTVDKMLIDPTSDEDHEEETNKDEENKDEEHEEEADKNEEDVEESKPPASKKPPAKKPPAKNDVDWVDDIRINNELLTDEEDEEYQVDAPELIRLNHNKVIEFESMEIRVNRDVDLSYSLGTTAEPYGHYRMTQVVAHPNGGWFRHNDMGNKYLNYLLGFLTLERNKAKTDGPIQVLQDVLSALAHEDSPNYPHLGSTAIVDRHARAYYTLLQGYQDFTNNVNVHLQRIVYVYASIRLDILGSQYNMDKSEAAYAAVKIWMVEHAGQKGHDPVAMYPIFGVALLRYKISKQYTVFQLKNTKETPGEVQARKENSKNLYVDKMYKQLPKRDNLVHAYRTEVRLNVIRELKLMRNNYIENKKKWFPNPHDWYHHEPKTPKKKSYEFVPMHL